MILTAHVYIVQNSLYHFVIHIVLPLKKIFCKTELINTTTNKKKQEPIIIYFSPQYFPFKEI